VGSHARCVLHCARIEDIASGLPSFTSACSYYRGSAKLFYSSLIAATTIILNQHEPYYKHVTPKICRLQAVHYGKSVGQRFTARQIARVRPTGPERPKRWIERGPCKLIVASTVARSSDPTRRSAAVLPSQSVALTNAGEAIFPLRTPAPYAARYHRLKV